MTLWTRFTAWLSGWPEGSAEGNKIKRDKELFAEEKEKIIKQSVEESQSRKTKKPKKKKTPKKSKGKGIKQGNMT